MYGAGGHPEGISHHETPCPRTPSANPCKKRINLQTFLHLKTLGPAQIRRGFRCGAGVRKNPHAKSAGGAGGRLRAKKVGWHQVRIVIKCAGGRKKGRKRRPGVSYGIPLLLIRVFPFTHVALAV